jgi:hypothetical protein
VGRILGGGWGVGGLEKGGNAPWAMDSQNVNPPQAANSSNTTKDGPIAPGIS